jgi:uncharacterized membrane protein
MRHGFDERVQYNILTINYLYVSCQTLCIFVLIAVGVGAMFLVSAWGGFGGTSKRSMWWGVLILPYPLGWIMGIVSLLFRLVGSVRHRHAAMAGRR